VLTVLVDGPLAEVFLGRSGVAALPIAKPSGQPPELVVSASPGATVRLTGWALDS